MATTNKHTEANENNSSSEISLMFEIDPETITSDSEQTDPPSLRPGGYTSQVSQARFVEFESEIKTNTNPTKHKKKLSESLQFNVYALEMDLKLNNNKKKELYQNNILKYNDNIASSIQNGAEIISESLKNRSTSNELKKKNIIQNYSIYQHQKNQLSFEIEKGLLTKTLETENKDYYKNDIAPSLRDKANILHKKKLSKDLNDALSSRATKEELLDNRILYYDTTNVKPNMQPKVFELENQLKKQIDIEYLKKKNIIKQGSLYQNEKDLIGKKIRHVTKSETELPDYYKHEIAASLQQSANTLHRKSLSTKMKYALLARPTKDELIDNRILYSDKMDSNIQPKAFELQNALNNRISQEYLHKKQILSDNVNHETTTPSKWIGFDESKKVLEKHHEKRPSTLDLENMGIVEKGYFNKWLNGNEFEKINTHKKGSSSWVLIDKNDYNQFKIPEKKKSQKDRNKEIIRQIINKQRLNERLSVRLKPEDLAAHGIIPSSNEEYFNDPIDYLKNRKKLKNDIKNKLELKLKSRPTIYETISRGIIRAEYFDFDSNIARLKIDNKTKNTKRRVSKQLNIIFNPQMHCDVCKSSSFCSLHSKYDPEFSNTPSNITNSDTRSQDRDDSDDSELEKIRALNRKIERRPSQQLLLKKHILYSNSNKVAPSIQALSIDLNKKFKKRKSINMLIQNKTDSYQNELDKLKSQLKHKDNLITKLNNELETERSYKNSINQEIIELENLLNKKDYNNINYNDDKPRNNNEFYINSLKYEIIKLVNTINDNDLKNKFDKLMTEWDENKRLYENLKDEYKSEKNRLENKVNELMLENSKLMEDIDRIENENKNKILEYKHKIDLIGNSKMKLLISTSGEIQRLRDLIKQHKR